MWGTAVHGEWCEARTWPTRCPTCSEDVFFFMCNCRSKVFFDELGPPWPIHDCDTSWTRRLRRTTDETGRITVELSEGITVIRSPVSFEIEEDVISSARKCHSNQASDPIVRIEPAKGSHKSFVGVLREINRQVRPLEFYELDNTAMAIAMLGPIGAQEMGRITVHAPSLIGDQTESFTLWIPSDLLRDPRIVRGITVSLVLESVEILGQGFAWFSDEFEIMG